MKTATFDTDVLDDVGVRHDVFYLAPAPVRPDNLFIQVNRAGITCRTPADFHIIRNETYPFNTLHCVFRGKGTLKIRGKTYALTQGKVFFFTAHEGHEYYSDRDDPMGLVWVEFGGGDSSRLTSFILDTAGPVFDGPVFQEVTERCTSLLYQQDWTPARVSQILYDLLMVPCRECSDTTERNPQHQEILDFIDANLGERLTLAEIARRFGYHPSYFSSIFPQIAGMKFSAYLLHRRIHQACCLLITTQLSLEQIATGLGFCDMSHFVSRFKAETGITPARYRKESQGLAAGQPLLYLVNPPSLGEKAKGSC